MAAGGLDYSVRNKLDTQYLRDMAQLADRVRQVERLKAEKARTDRFPKKEKVAYVEAGDSDPEFDWGADTIEDSEVNLAELKDGPPYSCKLLRPSNGKILRSLKTTNILLKLILLTFLNVTRSLISWSRMA